MSVEIGTPDDLLAAHPETAYFWGRVAGDGRVTEDGVTVRAGDGTAAERLAAIAGAEQVDHRILEREYAHDTAITRTEDEYTVQVFGPVASRASAALGLPLGSDPGGYRFEVFRDQRRQLLRGLVEGCATVCFKSDAGTVGVSFVHEDERLLARVRGLLGDHGVPHGDLAEASSGHWFGIEDDAVPEFGDWLYDGSESTGLFAPSRRRKLRRSIEQAEG
jgi:hypothetical protein